MWLLTGSQSCLKIRQGEWTGDQNRCAATALVLNSLERGYSADQVIQVRLIGPEQMNNPSSNQFKVRSHSDGFHTVVLLLTRQTEPHSINLTEVRCTSQLSRVRTSNQKLLISNAEGARPATEVDQMFNTTLQSSTLYTQDDIKTN